jgi:pimeloyl-ACP methyl ester carboxylesterase
MQDIYVEDVGKGPVLVLVHGFLGSSEMWRPQIKYFKKNFRVLAPALPGFGKSGKIVSCDSIGCMAKSILNSLKIRGIKKFNLIGHSMGGMIVQEITKLAGDQILKLVCYGTGPIGNIPGRFETIDETRKKLKHNGLKVTANRIAKTWFVEKNKANFFYLCKNAVEETTLEAADNGLRAMKNWNGTDNLKNIRNKTLIVWGEHDKAYNYKQVENLKKNIQNSSLEIIKDCSHNAHLEKPDEFNVLINNFLG